MSKKIIFAIIIFAFCFGSVFSQGLNIKLDIKEAKLENGLRILTLEDHSIPNLTYFTFFKVGSRNEHPGITGISHLFEHMMFNGAKKYGPKEFDRVLENNGGVSNAYTTEDITAYYEDAPSDKIELLVDLDSDRMCCLDLNQKMLTSEREVVKEERRLRTDDSIEGKMFEELMALTYKAHPYQWPVVGWMEDLNNISLEDCQNYFKTYYAPNNATIIVVGDFKTDEVVTLIKKYYGNIFAQKPPREVANSEEPQKGERRAEFYKTAQMPAVAVAYHVPSVKSDEIFALDVLQTIIATGESSRLYKTLVYDKQIALNVYGYFPWAIDPAPFILYIQVKPDKKTSEAEEILYSEIEKIKNEPVSDTELQKAKNILQADFIKRLKTNNGKARTIGTYQTLFGDYKRMFEVIDKYNKVTKDDIIQVAKKYFNKNNRNVVTLIPEKEGAD